MPDYSVQRFRGGWAIVHPMLDDAGNQLFDKNGKPKRRRRQLDAPDKASAEAEARIWWTASQGSTWSVGRIVNAYIADREAEGIASTARQKDAWKAMRSFWENVQPSMIDREMAQCYAAMRGMAEATVRYELGMLSVALRWAAAKDFIPNAKEVWRPSPPDRQTRHLTRSEFERWFEHVKAPHARLYVELGLATMARPTAILELTWDRVDLERGTVDLNPRGRRQTRKRRPVVPLNDDAVAALETAYEGRQSNYVIERGGKQVSSIKKAFQAASARSGIHVTPYTLRHTGAVWAAEAGVPMAELARFMGHQDSITTERHYIQYSPDHLRRVAKAVQRKAKPRQEVQNEPSTPVCST